MIWRASVNFFNSSTSSSPLPVNQAFKKQSDCSRFQSAHLATKITTRIKNHLRTRPFPSFNVYYTEYRSFLFWLNIEVEHLTTRTSVFQILSETNLSAPRDGEAERREVWTTTHVRRGCRQVEHIIYGTMYVPSPSNCINSLFRSSCSLGVIKAPLIPEERMVLETACLRQDLVNTSHVESNFFNSRSF